MRTEKYRGSMLVTQMFGLLLGLLGLHLGVSRLHADTYGYEFRPGPHAPAGFRPGPGADASGLDLSASVFTGMDLSNAKFTGTNLRRARFYQVRFSSGGASFKDADLRGAAFLESPNGPHRNGFEGCDFSGALINGLGFFRQQDHLSLEQIRSTKSYQLKDLSSCQIVAGISERQAYDQKKLAIRPVTLDLRGFDLRRATLVAGDFAESSFTDSVITEATFVRSKVTPEQILSTKLYELDSETDVTTGSVYANRTWRLASRQGYSDIGFSLVDLSDWDFTDADLQGAKFHDVNLTGVSFKGADISGAEFWKSIGTEQLISTKSYQEGNLARISFVWLDLTRVTFANQNLTQAQFVYCDVRGVDFTDAIITRAGFQYMDFPPTLDQIKSTWNYKHGRMEGIRLPEELAEALRQE